MSNWNRGEERRYGWKFAVLSEDFHRVVIVVVFIVVVIVASGVGVTIGVLPSSSSSSLSSIPSRLRAVVTTPYSDGTGSLGRGKRQLGKSLSHTKERYSNIVDEFILLFEYISDYSYSIFLILLFNLSGESATLQLPRSVCPMLYAAAAENSDFRCFQHEKGARLMPCVWPYSLRHRASSK